VARGKKHDDATRAAVMAALLAGQGVNEVAAAYQLDSGLVSRWKAKIPATQLQQVAVEKKERLVDLIENHLIASLKGAAKLADQTDNDKWRDSQTASDLAIFYGVLSDKSIRLLEIASRVFASTDGAHANPHAS